MEVERKNRRCNTFAPLKPLPNKTQQAIHDRRGSYRTPGSSPNNNRLDGIIDAQFESSRFKLSLLSRYEKMMAAERQATVESLVAEIKTQNRVLQDIRSKMTGGKQEVHPRSSRASSRMSVRTPISLNNENQPRKSDSSRNRNAQRPSSRTSKLSDISNLDFIEEKPDEQEDSLSSVSGSRSSFTSIGTNNNQAKNLFSYLDNQREQPIIVEAEKKRVSRVQLDPYLVNKQKLLVKKQIELLKLKKSMIEYHKKNEQDTKRVKKVMQGKKKMLSQLVQDLISKNVLLDQPQLKILKAILEQSTQASQPCALQF